MKRLIAIVFVCFALGTIAQNQPKLIVGIVVDQMRTDYIYRYWDKYENDGFKRLLKDGYFCKNVHHNYIPTYTGPGHASIFTGTTPMEHGIIANTWYDKNSSDNLYCVGDSTANSIGTISDQGKMSPLLMLAPTLGDAVRMSSLFKGKSIGISIKDRSAILPAGHSANAAYWMDYGSGHMITSDYYMDALPKWVSKFNASKTADKLADKGWKLTLAKELYTESTEDNTIYEKQLITGVDPVFPYDVSRAISESSYYSLACTPHGNTYLRLFAEQVLINEDLGQDESMDLLTISFSSPDMIGHMFGPQSIETEDTYLKLDLEIAQLIEALDTRVGEGNYVLFLTADHAAAPVPQYAHDNGFKVDYFNLADYKKGMDELLFSKFNIEGIISNYSNQQIFLNWELIEDNNLDQKEISSEIRKYSLGFDGVANMLDIKQLQHALPPDNFSRLAANGWNPLRSGDLLLQLLPGWMSYGKQGTTHGSSYSYDTHVPLLFYGWNIGHGENLEPIDITQIAPTISLHTNISFPDASSHKGIMLPGK